MKKQIVWIVGLPALIGIIVLAAVSINFELSFIENENSFLTENENTSFSEIPKAVIIAQDY